MEAERTLRTSESRYRTLIETSPDGISLLDLQGKIVFANRNKSRMLGAAAPEDLVGESAFAFVVPEDHVRARHWWAELLATGTLANAETTLIRRDGTRFPAEMHAALISDESGAPIGVMDIIRDITQRELASRSLRASLREKEILLKEIHHRVKNNLQVISSLLSLQSSAIADTSVQALFRESIDRVRSMALVHERMYRSNDLAQTDFAEYARTVTQQLARSYGQPGVECDVEADDIHLSIEAAVPCGLILNELVSNALKHAFPDGRSGRIRVTLRADTEGSVELIVEDNGVGIPGGFDDRSESSMGMTLIASLVEQLTGTIRWERDHGTIVTIRFPR
jgi:PAS domain S-box-containing protein